MGKPFYPTLGPMIIPRNIEKQLGSFEQGRVKTDDGVELLYQSFGQGPVILFANGIGVRYPGLVIHVPLLRQRYRMVTWDYRGMGQSVVPSLDADVSMARQAKDALAILNHLQVKSAIVVGWSMGVQVGLELLRLEPERIVGFVALLGAYRRPFRTAFPRPVALALESFFRLLKRYPHLVQSTLGLAVALPNVTFKLLQSVRFINDKIDAEIFATLVRSVAGVDKRIYTRTFFELARHDAQDMLAKINCPTLVIAGQYDYFSPPKNAQTMAAMIPSAKVLVVPKTTHFAMYEETELVNRALSDFFDGLSEMRDMRDSL